uniref:Nucleotide exchange factor Fes1 domain-containing protein n=1 Tax=Helicotheca tamesis TaxID=374047 RepID=A0A7S2IJG9_9STRA|mmetsp:Transcript_9699/g.13582  ORF Transcript_9699/g.13582 Transcript_9699/m.13582 type:complete len:393 (+) Transcript_9699:148-1326(+)|eukprot:CAMPEP_0185726634 /NCGR_PEP_ID=MMETSP1171-20130828/2546_1 /TAXON_ID=374046 /ORGANISM="Helicotheca tamensis, Strain CCMP826" /LENGTH=392 /DNA_ID=CAMNT_0028395019 /DNA_START=76 /DNA_END=1254 /DNA_ORIENTATION=-
MSSSGAGGDGGGNSPFAWMGLLKWSLAHQDGTRPSSESKPMSDEDIKFLEAVMKDGIIDEGDRMKTILSDLTESLEAMRDNAIGETGSNAEEQKRKELSEEEISDLLLELRDIVEQIDYARAFTAMGGLPFLIGCASERNIVPRSIRSACLGILATLCQNNPPVQQSLIEMGHIRSISDLYFGEYPEKSDIGSDDDESDGMVRTKAVQALSCSVRGHAAAEDLLSNDDNGRRVIESGLGMHSDAETLPSPPLKLRKRCLFLLRALVTSDTATEERVGLFAPCIRHVAGKFLDIALEPDAELREMSLELLAEVLRRKKGTSIVMNMKGALGLLGVQRLSVIKELNGEEREFADVELENWEGLLVELAKIRVTDTEEDKDSSSSDGPVLLLGGP